MSTPCILRLILWGGVLWVAGPAGAATRFVDDTAPPGGDGLSWATAFSDLQQALEAARQDPAIDAVHVAAGTYRPDGATLDRTRSFDLVDGVALLGGFPEGGGDPAERDPDVHVTLLSGDLLGDDGPPDAVGLIPGSTENSHHVVRAAGLTATTRLDGVTVRGGRADGGGPVVERSGGDVLIEGGGLTVHDCVFERAYATWGGAGLAAVDAAVSVSASRFAENRGDSFGAGAAVFGATPVQFTACTFVGNIGGAGSGVFSGPLFPGSDPGADVVIEGCSFIDNTGIVGATAGGGVFIGNAAAAVVRDTRFIGNFANGGAGVYAQRSPVWIERCLFQDNAVNGDGGGAVSAEDFADTSIADPVRIVSSAIFGNSGAFVAIAMDLAVINCTVADNVLDNPTVGEDWPTVVGQNATVTLANSILWGNRSGPFGDERDQLVEILDAEFLVTHTIVEHWQGVLPGDAQDVEPQFVDPPANDYRLSAASPAIDSGDGTLLPPRATLDLAGLPRVLDGDSDGTAEVDLGAYEFGAAPVPAAAPLGVVILAGLLTAAAVGVLRRRRSE